jgi:hypothetical protein
MRIEESSPVSRTGGDHRIDLLINHLIEEVRYSGGGGERESHVIAMQRSPRDYHAHRLRAP